MEGGRQGGAWDRFLRLERALLRERERGKLARALGRPLPGEDPEELARVAAEDEELARRGLARLLREDGSAYHLGVDDLTPENAPDRIRAEQEQTAWLKGRAERARPLPRLWGSGPPSARELQVLRLVARGMNNREVAGELHLAEATVKRHLANVYARLKVRSRTEAMRAALEGGWISAGDIYGGGGRSADGDGAGVSRAISHARYRCREEGCGREVVVARESDDPGARGTPPACHGQEMAPVGARLAAMGNRVGEAGT